MFKRSILLFLVLCDTVSCATSVSEVGSTKQQIRPRPFDGVPTLDYTRTRRGIVLVDDDFNVSPEPGVNQGWSDGGSTGKLINMEEGSGTSSELEDISNPKYAFKTSPGKLELVSKETKLTSETDDMASKGTRLTSETDDMASDGTKLTSETEDIEGSGDISTGHPTEVFRETIPSSCLNSKCDSRDVMVLSGHSEVVPVGSNISLTCIQVNATEPGTLQWYKHNESVNALLEAVNQRLELTFGISKSVVEHSGTYTCVRSSRESCCHRHLDIRVYEVPNYRYHLTIIGVVAAVSLFSCLLLAVCRNVRAKKYEVQLELENMEENCIYKM